MVWYGMVPYKTAPFLRAHGTDGQLARHVQGLTYVDLQAAQELDVPPRTSTSHLGTDSGSGPTSAQLWTKLSMV